MSAFIKKYRIQKKRLASGLMDGFHISDSGAIIADENEARHNLFLGSIDSNQVDCPWGRLVFNLALEEEAVIIVRAFASDEKKFVKNGEIIEFNDFLLDVEVPIHNKEKVFNAANASKFIGSNDCLLYEQKGRYLWIYIEILGKGNAKIENINIYAPGDNFFNTFPEIYRRDGEFLHRYLSVFSSLYLDLQETVDSLDQYVDVETAPAPLLPTFASWLGIQLDGDFLDENQLRKFLSIGFKLMKGKGTRQTIEDIIHIFVEEPVFIVEQRLIQEPDSTWDRKVYQQLYGKNLYGFTVLINSNADEKIHSKLIFLLNQFKPLRCSVKIIFLGECCSMDAHCYMDINSKISPTMEGRLDKKANLGGMVFLQ